MDTSNCTPEELEQLEELTNTIVYNLKYIEEHTHSGTMEELEALEERTNTIVANLKTIDQS